MKDCVWVYLCVRVSMCVCVCVHVYVYVHVCVQGGEVSQKGDGVEEWKCLKAFHFAYYNCNLTIFLQALDLYALPCFWYYWFCLDLAINNTAQCILLFRTKDTTKRVQVTAVYGTLILLIIGANLLLIIGIIKTKGSKFTQSQISFSTLFVSDLTFGVVQMPSMIYLLWKSSEPTCFEVKLSVFSTSFPMCMSFNVMCSFSWEIYLCCAKAIAKTYIAVTAYSGTVLSISIVFNVALLTNVKRKTKKSSIQQILDSSLTKTIGLIIDIMVAAYLPIIIAINIAAYAYISSADQFYIKKRGSALLWALVPSQFNAVLNSVIYLTRNSRMRRYYSKFFNCRTKENNMKQVDSPASNVSTDTRNSR